MMRKLIISLITGTVILLGILFIKPMVVDSVEYKYDEVGFVGDYLLYVDKTADTDADNVERFYQDDDYDYYLTNSQSYLLIKDEEIIELKKGLEENKIDINDLRNVLTDISVKTNLSKYDKIGKAGKYDIYKDNTVLLFAQALELIYVDTEYYYYLPSISSYIYLLVNEDEEIDLKTALKDGKINIADVRKVITNIYAVERNDLSVDSKYQRLGVVGDYVLYKDTTYSVFPQMIEVIYEDSLYVYYLPTLSSSIYLLVNDSEQLGLIEALEQGKINIADLQKVIKIYVNNK